MGSQHTHWTPLNRGRTWRPFHRHVRLCWQAVQVERESKLTKILIDKLQPYVLDDKDAFTAWATAESSRLANASKAPSRSIGNRQASDFRN